MIVVVIILFIAGFAIPNLPRSRIFFFFNDTATTEIYTLSLHDALPISYNSGFTDNLNKLGAPAAGSQPDDIGSAHVCTPVTLESRIPSSACKKKVYTFTYAGS